MDWLASHPLLEQPTKRNNTWKNKRKYVGPKYTSETVLNKVIDTIRENALRRIPICQCISTCFFHC